MATKEKNKLGGLAIQWNHLKQPVINVPIYFQINRDFEKWRLNGVAA